MRRKAAELRSSVLLDFAPKPVEALSFFPFQLVEPGPERSRALDNGALGDLGLETWRLETGDLGLGDTGRSQASVSPACCRQVSLTRPFEV